MKDKKTLWGRVHIDNYQHVILRNVDDVDLTRLLAFDYEGKFVNVEISVRNDQEIEQCDPPKV
ncbi:unnamed protein product [marine sediment metagenome]|uniref:Uncharacterized protein n=1 Tax=marine sediment metagenome TaxID=412755 RepID=X1KV62_9ZZZZ